MEHNAKHHDSGKNHGLIIEETCQTTRWSNSVFSFILSVTEINAYLAHCFWGGYKGPQIDWWKKLVYELIHNTYDNEKDGIV